jgi:hypothetical protein
MPKVKAWKNKLNLDSYKESQTSILQVVGDVNCMRVGEKISIPVPIMYRFYHLGRAYDFQAMKLFRPEGKILIDWIHLQQICGELEYLSEIVIDPVITHFTALLLPVLQSFRTEKGAKMVIVSP